MSHPKREPGESDEAWLERLRAHHQATRFPPMMLCEPEKALPGEGPYDGDEGDDWHEAPCACCLED